jgi:hypothetical protein
MHAFLVLFTSVVFWEGVLETQFYFFGLTPLMPPVPLPLETIEIINNTRGGIVILIQSKKGNAAIGGQI